MGNPSQLFLDMVHHNPGEAPFETRFTKPGELAALGYTGQVLKHLNACVSFVHKGETEFPTTPEETAWLESASAERDAEIAATRRAGIEVFYHVDLFVLPKNVVERHRDDICDEDGKIDLTRPLTLALHRELIRGMFERYPDVKGLVIRVGETYLFDTPHHTGNTAVPLYDASLKRSEQIRRFSLLLNFLREEVCQRHARTLIFRTWDVLPDGFHSSPDFYLGVTDQVEPHPRFFFSIKHTRADFFRGSVPNPCLGQGRHRQIVEIQCQREYEGKGAYPSYIARGVIDGFAEVPHPIGLREWSQSPLWAGAWTWSRGGGWFGPYLKNEFWCELNVRVIAEWMRSPGLDEATAFDHVCACDFGMDISSRTLFRELCLTAEQAIWLGRSSPVLARLTNYSQPDVVELWMRDDRLGGMEQVEGLFAQLHAANLLSESMAEKREAVELYRKMERLASKITARDPMVAEVIQTSTAYGAGLFAIVAEGWELMARVWRHRQGLETTGITKADMERYRKLWSHYRTLPQEHPFCASLYEEAYWAWPGQTPCSGMTQTLEEAFDTLLVN